MLANGAGAGFARQLFRTIDGALLVDIGTDQAGVDCKAFAAYQAFRHAPGYDHLEQPAQQVAVTEPAMAVFGEGRMVGHVAVQTQAAELAIRHVQMHLIAQTTLDRIPMH